jgi:hypothetical protein
VPGMNDLEKSKPERWCLGWLKRANVMVFNQGVYSRQGQE